MGVQTFLDLLQRWYAYSNIHVSLYVQQSSKNMY